MLFDELSDIFNIETIEFDFSDYEDNCRLEFDAVWTGGSVPIYQCGLLLPSSWYLMNDDAGCKTPWNFGISITYYTPSHPRR